MVHRVCMASDFFYPNVGGVEGHIYNLSQCIIKQGNKVIVVTHSYKDRVGIRYMSNGLKVYYLPMKVFYNQCVLPTMVSTLPLIRYILIRERITVVHGHSAFSTLCHEVMMVGKILKLKTVFTDHSLFGFADTSAIITNKFLEISLCAVDHCICVSHVGKENTVLRGRVSHNQVSVIPNAIDSSLYVPRADVKPRNRIVIISISRLVYRKGIDLLAQIIADVCVKYNNVDFIIGGSGPKLSILEDVKKQHNIGERLTLLGAVEQCDVSSVLNSGHIFINTSITEAYCMAIVEAASCGLYVVSTNVGGIPEVLPSHLIYLADPSVSALVKALDVAIHDVKRNAGPSAFERHLWVSKTYNWQDVASRTCYVYQSVSSKPPISSGKHISSYIKSGVWPFILLVSLLYLMISALNWIVPESSIDYTKDFPLLPKKKTVEKEMKRKLRSR